MRQSFRIRGAARAALACALLMGCGDDDSDDDAQDDAGGVLRDAGVDSGVRPDGGIDAGGMDAARDAASDASGDTGNAADAAVRLTDPQIVGVAAAVNTSEIEAGTLAQTKAVSTATRTFATMMITAHTAAQTRQSALGVAPVDSDASQQVRSSAMMMAQMLQNQPAGAGFDALYLDTQVMAHTMALGLIDERLLPSVTSQALRTELMTTRAEVVMHLNEATALRNLARDGGLPPADGGSADAGADSGT